MKDEEYLFYQDVREKKVTGYSARKQRSHCGKRGRVKFPSDYLTKKELKNMSGECKSYRLNSPMKWHEFKAMPEDIQITYIKLIKDKWNATNDAIAKMMGCDRTALSRHLQTLGFAKQRTGKRSWDKDGFDEWCYGLPKQESQSLQEFIADVPLEDVEMYLTVEEDVSAEAEQEDPADEIPCSEEVTTSHENIPSEELAEFCETIAKDNANVFAIPESGSLTFTGNAVQILNTLGSLLGNAKVLLSVKWDVVE